MSYDIIGNIAILKPEKGNHERARKILKERPNVKTVLEKIEKVKGQLRTIKTKHLAGVKNKEAEYVENGCKFKFNVEKCYFSPRLAGERLEIAQQCKKTDRVLVLFSGVAPFGIVISKISGARVINVELGKECCKYARENVRLNRVANIDIIQGNVKNLSRLIKKEKFDKIVMPRPQTSETFLSYIWPYCKSGTKIYYYDFGKFVDKLVERVKKEAKSARKKIKILKIKKAGEIAPYKFRWRIDIRIVK
jgi:tRNA (guanine37-N1)-methyltransferase